MKYLTGLRAFCFIWDSDSYNLIGPWIGTRPKVKSTGCHGPAVQLHTKTLPSRGLGSGFILLEWVVICKLEL
jgi:hypothetical protein